MLVRAAISALFVLSTLSTPLSSQKLDCVLPKPRVVVTKDCHFVDGTSWVSRDCKRMHFGQPRLDAFDPLPTNDDRTWYYTFAEPLVLAVADSPPWGLIQAAMAGNMTGKEMTHKLWIWQLSHHLVVSMVLGFFGLTCLVWAIRMYTKVKSIPRQRFPRRPYPNQRSALIAGLVGFLLLTVVFLIVSTSNITTQWEQSHSNDVIRKATYNMNAYVNNTITLASHLVNDQLNFLLGTATSRLDTLGHLVANQASWLVFNATNNVTEAVLNIVNESRRAVDALNSINEIETALLRYQKRIQKQLSVVQHLSAAIDCSAVNVSMDACFGYSDNITNISFVTDFHPLPDVTSVATIASQVYKSDLSKQAAAVWPKFQGIPCTIQTEVDLFLKAAKKEVIKLHQDVVGNVDAIFPSNVNSLGKNNRSMPGGNSANSVLKDSNSKATEHDALSDSDGAAGQRTQLHHRFSLIQNGNESTLDDFWESYHWESVVTTIWGAVQKMFHYFSPIRGYINVIVFTTASLLLPLLAIPICLSTRKLRGFPWCDLRLPNALRNLSQRHFVKMYVVLLPVATCLLLVSAGCVYFVAGTAGIICQPLRSMEFLNKTIDNVPEVFPEYVLSKYAMPPGSPPMTIRELLEDCQRNESLYHALRLDRRVDIHSLFNISKVRDLVDKHLSQASSAFTIKNQEILTISDKITLLRLHSNTSGLKSISFKSFDTVCNTPVLSASPKLALQWLYLVMDEVSALAHGATKNGTGRKLALQQESLQLLTVRQELAALIKLADEAKEQVEKLCREVQVIKNILYSAVDQIPKTLDSADNLSKTLQAKAPQLVNELMESYVSNLYSWANTFIHYSIDMISNQLGNCRPVADIWDGVVYTACGYTASGLNTIYVLILICIVLSIPTVILVPKLQEPTSYSDSQLLLNDADMYSVALEDVHDDLTTDNGSRPSGLLSFKDSSSPL
eukprot:scpid18259/ scgid25129/ Prominin-1-A; Prominin-like protein 1